MDWQLVVVVAAVLTAAVYVGRASWRTWAKPGCGSGCGRCATAPPEPVGRRIALGVVLGK